MSTPSTMLPRPALPRLAPDPGADRRFAARVADLQRAFDQVWRTRMQGLPVLNPALWVEAVDFERSEDGHAALGVLVTPWFMNLIRLPLDLPGADEAADWPVGGTRLVEVGGETFGFIGASDPAVGPFAMCSLFSPMFEFASQTAARATAQAVLLSLRGRAEPVADIGSVGSVAAAPPVKAVVPATPVRAVPPTAATAAMAPPARRAFLFGRTAAEASR